MRSNIEDKTVFTAYL